VEEEDALTAPNAGTLPPARYNHSLGIERDTDQQDI